MKIKQFSSLAKVDPHEILILADGVRESLSLRKILPAKVCTNKVPIYNVVGFNLVGSDIHFENQIRSQNLILKGCNILFHLTAFYVGHVE